MLRGANITITRLRGEDIRIILNVLSSARKSYIIIIRDIVLLITLSGDMHVVPPWNFFNLCFRWIQRTNFSLRVKLGRRLSAISWFLLLLIVYLIYWFCKHNIIIIIPYHGPLQKLVVHVNLTWVIWVALASSHMRVATQCWYCQEINHYRSFHTLTLLHNNKFS